MLKKLCLLLRPARQQYYVRRLDSLNKKRYETNLEVFEQPDGLKKSIHKEFIVDGASTNNNT